jgi:hypothetical protein
MRRTLAMLLAAAPFVAGLIAALSPRRDMRILWMAAVATLIAHLVIALSSTGRTRNAIVGAFAAATVAASVVAVALGARGVVGVAAVAIVLAAFATAGAVLNRATIK